MCECGANLKMLKQGLYNSIQHYKDMISRKICSDYMYMTCSCGKWEEFTNCKYDFIHCPQCNNVYCYQCNQTLVTLVHDTVLCSCDNVSQYITCSYDHAYCTNCCLKHCDECILIEDHIPRDDNCPFCNKRFQFNDRILCEFHHQLNNTTV